MGRHNYEYNPHNLHACVVDPSCPDEEWWEEHAKSNKSRNYNRNRNFVQRVAPGSIALVPRASRGVVFAGRIEGKFRLENDPQWYEDYLEIRWQQNLSHIDDEEKWHAADVAQCWEVDQFRSIPYPAIPEWIRRSLFGRSTYGEIYPLNELGLDPYAELDRIIETPALAVRPWTSDVDEIEHRLIANVGPGPFEHLCVALLQLERPQEVWAHVGGSGDGGVDGIGADETGKVVGLLQCKWRYSGEDVAFMSPWDRDEGEQRRVLAALIHHENISVSEGLDFWGRRHIAHLVAKTRGQFAFDTVDAG